MEPKLEEAWPEGLGLSKGFRCVTHLRRLGTWPIGAYLKSVYAPALLDSSEGALASSTLDRV